MNLTEVTPVKHEHEKLQKKKSNSFYAVDNVIILSKLGHSTEKKQGQYAVMSQEVEVTWFQMLSGGEQCFGQVP